VTKNLGEPGLGPLQNAALVAFEVKEIIGPQFLSDEAAALLLTMEGISSNQTAFQRPFGQLLEQRLKGGNTRYRPLNLPGVPRHRLPWSNPWSRMRSSMVR